MLFLRKRLQPGATLPQGTKLLADNAFPRPREFISKVDSDVIPFGYRHLDEILALFSIPRGSRMSDQVASTLRTCEASFDEPHTCATSVEAATEFATDALGTSHLRRAVLVVRGREPRRYIIAQNGIKRIGPPGARMVPCHPLPYPYVIRFCHNPDNVEAFSVELTGETADAEGGAAITAVAVCHSNTTNWDNRYFQMLNATPGEQICQFMPENYQLWVTAATQ
ncbi:hypothetical protein BS78_K126600 [Paspalum vaginatum]|uniref:BURP domain-containing protein n=1 Tax=Paspalum vaginatum TaxID=158149 RepID=A0A9W8CCX1_9POAL|nr:hypothetical protein BS78_K126600 [Paspalum vaginatum]